MPTVVELYRHILRRHPLTGSSPVGITFGPRRCACLRTRAATSLATDSKIGLSCSLQLIVPA